MNYFFDNAPDTELPDLQDESVLHKLASTVLTPLAWLAQTIDKPGRAIRGLLAGQPSELLNLVPFSDTLGITDPNQSVTGRDLLRKMGMADQEDTWGNFFGGLGTEILLDPLNALSLGTKSALTATGRELAKAGTLGKTAAERLATKEAGLIGVRTPFWWDAVGMPRGSTPFLTGDSGQAVLNKLGQVGDWMTDKIPGVSNLRSMFQYGAGFTGNKQYVPIAARTTGLAEQAAKDSASEALTNLFGISERARNYLDELKVPGPLAEDAWSRAVTQAAEGGHPESFFVPGINNPELNTTLQQLAGEAAPHIQQTQNYLRDLATANNVPINEAKQIWGDYLHRRAITGSRQIRSQQEARTFADEILTGGSRQIDDLVKLRELSATPTGVQEGNAFIAGIARNPNMPAGFVEKRISQVADQLATNAKAHRDSVYEAGKALEGLDPKTFTPEQLQAYTSYQNIKKHLPWYEKEVTEDVLQEFKPQPQDYVSPAPSGAAPKEVTILDLLGNWKNLKKADRQEVVGFASKMGLENDRMLNEAFTHQQILKSAKKYGVLGDEPFQDLIEQIGKEEGRRLLTLKDIEPLQNISANYFQMVTDVAQSKNAVSDILEKLGQGKGWDKYGEAITGIMSRKLEENPGLLEQLSKPAAVPVAQEVGSPLFTKNTVTKKVIEQDPAKLLSDFNIEKKAKETAQALANLDPEVAAAARGLYKPDPLLNLTEYVSNLAPQIGTGTSVVKTLAQEAKPLSQFKDVKDLGKYVTLEQAVRDTGGPGQTYATLKALLPEDAKLTELYVPRDLVSDLGREMAGPKGLNKIGLNLDPYLTSLRSFLTVIAPPYHARNLWEGFIQSGMHGGLSAEGYKDAFQYLRGGITDAAKAKELGQYAAEAYGSGAVFRGQAIEYMGKPVVKEEQRAIAPWVKQEGKGIKEQSVDFLKKFKPEEGQSYFTPNPANNPLVQRGMDVHVGVDNLNRFAQFVTLRRQGYGVEAARDLVMQAQLDYGKLTPFERNVMRNVIPFYAFSKANLGRLATQAGNPGPLSTMIRTIGEAGEQGTVPGYVSPGGAIPVPGAEDGKQRYISGFSLPVEDEAFLSLAALASGNIRGAFQRGMSAANPLTKLAATLATGQQIFSGRPLDELQANPLLSLGGLVPNQAAVYAGEALGATPLGRLLTMGNAAVASKDQNILLKLLTGVRTTDVDPQMANRLAAQDAVTNMLKATGMVKSREIVYPRQEYKDAENQPQRLQMLLQLMKGLDAQRRTEARTP